MVSAGEGQVWIPAVGRVLKQVLVLVRKPSRLVTVEELRKVFEHDIVLKEFQLGRTLPLSSKNRCGSWPERSKTNPEPSVLE